MAITAGNLILGGLLLAASFLLRPKPKNPTSKLREDDTPTTIATRGSFIPVVLGRRRTGYVFGWAGNRETRSEVVGTTSTKGKKKKTQTQTVYYETGWHKLSVGQGLKMFRITQSGNTIWSGEITPFTHPSGSTLTADNGEGTFRIYWGEIDQPIDSVLAAGVGVNSRWPRVMYVLWDKKRLGTSASWPPIEYEYEVGCLNNFIGGVPPKVGATGQDGANPANMLFQLLTGAFPFGVGLLGDDVDLTSLLDLSSTCQTEGLGMNVWFQNGEIAGSAIASILEEAGCMLVQNGDRLMFIVVRAPVGTLPILDEDVLLPPDVEYDLGDEDNAADRLIFTYKDRNNNYRDVDVKIDNDANASRLRRYNSVTVPIETVTTSESANKVASRRAQEELGNKQRLRVQATRGFRSVLPGELVELSGFGNVRILSKSYNSKDPNATLELTPDSYGIPLIGDDQGSVSSSGSPLLGVAADIAFTFQEIPEELAGDSVAIVVLRLRAHNQISGANVFLSSNAGSSYTFATTESYFSQGGQIEQSILADTTDVIENGPTFEDANNDAQFTLDLSGDDAAWQNGKQIAIINDEVFFVQNIEVQAESTWAATTAYIVGDYVIPSTSTGLRYRCISGGTSAGTEPVFPTEHGETVVDGTVTWEARYSSYRLKNMIRAQYGSVKAAHTAGDYVFIADANSLEQIEDAVLEPGLNICVKTQPFVGGEQLDLSLVTAICKDVLGVAVGSPDFLEIGGGGYLQTNTGKFIEIGTSSLEE